uniref:Uncharacterized protein n=1 Tax=Anopheles merus TaxID=30066 RepID=A0A182V885_ANOME
MALMTSLQCGGSLLPSRTLPSHDDLHRSRDQRAEVARMTMRFAPYRNWSAFDPVDVTPSRNLPQHQPERVHIRPLERIELRHVDRLIQHLRGHVALGADAVRRRLVDRVGRDDVTHRQPQVADAARQVRLHQYVLRLEVPVSDRGLAARTDNVHVQMGQPGRYRERHLEHRVRIDAAGSEKIEQRPILVIIRHQPELRPGAVI